MNIHRSKSYLAPLVLTVVFGLLFTLLISEKSVSALSGSQWQAGRIIDDVVFFNPHTMGPSEIQTFLNSKVPSCDTNGSQIHSSGMTRAQWAAANGKPLPPYICLKAYTQNIPATSPDSYCTSPISGGTKTAAQIIKDVSMACSINPQALLVLLQKEQSLITDDWPWPVQYQSATGYGCPDTADCDSQYYGFFNQVYNAARQYQRYAANPNDYNYAGGQTSFVQFNPNAGSCGGTNVFMHNQATAGLYNYTPYQPNQAALNNLYGTGDGCSSYGNRNFWRLFHDWFGTTYAINGTVKLASALQLSPSSNVRAGDTISATYEVENTASYDVYAGGLGICARLNGAFYDFGFIHHQYIAANDSVTINFSKFIDAPGTLSIFMCSYHEAVGGWASTYYPYDTVGYPRQTTINVLDNPLITEGISLSPSNPAAGQAVTATVKIHNAGSSPVNIGSLVVAARSPSGGNADFPIQNDVIIPAGATYTYSKTKSFSSTGNHTLFIARWSGVWSTSYPKSADGSVLRQTTVNILDNPLITTGIGLSDTSPTIGQPVTATMTITNASASPINIGTMVIAARDSLGNNVDFGVVNDVTIAANGGTYTYSKVRSFSASGSYTLFIANWNGVWSTTYPKSASGSIVRNLILSVGP